MTVSYDTENHISVLTQLYGSVWRKVLPYCLLNVVLVIAVHYLMINDIIDLTFSDKGHSFMGIMVSFLLVARSNIAISSYSDCRALLGDAMRACRELIQHMIAFTRYDTSDSAKEWREDIARRTVAMLRTVVAVLEYDTKGQHTWQISELTHDEKQAILLSVGDSNERAPMVLTIFLRTAIGANVEHLSQPLPVNKELKLFAFVSDFVTAYHGLMRYKTTPFPFPLVQMTRTFLFLWVFTLPFALARDMEKVYPLTVILFFITYGFVGLEMVSIELDDPFGDDPNDFDVLGLAQVVFEDIYISIYDIDGKQAAHALKASVELALPEQVKIAVSSYKKYSSIDAWKTSPKDLPDNQRNKSMILDEAVATVGTSGCLQPFGTCDKIHIGISPTSAFTGIQTSATEDTQDSVVSVSDRIAEFQRKTYGVDESDPLLKDGRDDV